MSRLPRKLLTQAVIDELDTWAPYGGSAHSPRNDYRADATPFSAFFARQLEFIRPEVFEVEYPELKARRFIPVSNKLPSGSELYTYRTYDKVGIAKLIAQYADDVPRVDIYGTESTSKIRGMAAAYGWSFQEMRNAQMAGLDLDSRKAVACRDAIERKLDTASLLGDTEMNLTGLFNQSGTNTTYGSGTAPNGNVGSPLWAFKTPQEILDDLNGPQQAIVVDSKEIEIPTTIILPLDSYNIIATRRMGDGSDQTILRFFLSTSQWCKSVETSYKLATAGAGSTRRMVTYRKDPRSLELIIPQEFEQFPPQTWNFETLILTHMRTGGVVLYKPKSMAYLDGI